MHYLTKLRKHIYSGMIGILLLSIGIFLFLRHATATFARGSNTDPLDPDFWTVQRNGTDAMILQAMFGDGNLGNDQTYYTQYWQSNDCDISQMTVNYIPSWSEVPLVFEQNTVYVFDAADYTITGALTVSGNCVGVTSKQLDRISHGKIYYASGIWSSVLYASWSHNIIVESINFLHHDTLGGSIGERPESGIECDNCSSSTLGVGVEGVQQKGMQILSGQYIMAGVAQSLNYGLYVDTSDHIYVGTPRPVAYFGFNQTGIYMQNTTNITLNVDPRWHYGVGVHIYQSTWVFLQSRYFTDNYGLGVLLEKVYSGTVYGYFSWNGKWGLRILNSSHIRSPNSWLDASANYSTWSYGMSIEDSQDIQITWATININASYGLLITGSNDITFANSSISSNSWWWILVINSQDIHFTNNQVRGNANDGVYLENASWFTFNNGNININGGYGIYATKLTKAHTYATNYITGNAMNGIYRQASNTDELAFNTVDGNDISSNGGAGIMMMWAGSQLTNNTISNNTLHDNMMNGIIMLRWYFSNFISNEVYNNGGTGGVYLYQTVGNTITDQNVYGNNLAWIRIEWLLNNSVYDTSVHDNIGAGLELIDTDNAILSGVSAYTNTTYGIDIADGSDNVQGFHLVSYGNTQNGLFIHGNSIRHYIEDLITFNNGEDGAYIGADTQDSTFQNVQSYSNTGNGITYASTQGSTTVNNAMLYNNRESGILLLEWARNGVFNNINAFANSFGVKAAGATLGIKDNAFNNIALFNNNTGRYLWPTTSPDNGDIWNDVYIYDNDAGIILEWPIEADNDVFYGNFYVYSNSIDIGANVPNQIVSELSVTPHPDVSRGPGVIKPGFGLPTSTTGAGDRVYLHFHYNGNNFITCNDAIQTSWSGSNIFAYPRCNTRGYNSSWLAGLWIEYTFFPHIQFQKQPVRYDAGTLSNTWLVYHDGMYVGDYSPYVDNAVVGWYFVPGTFPWLSYISWWIDYGNRYGLFDGQFISVSSDPIVMFTGVGDPVFDGMAYAAGAGVGYTIDINGLSLLDQEWVRIYRVSAYDTPNNLYSNYYGIMRWLAYDDISILKTASTGSVQEWTQIAFTITLTNSGALAGSAQVYDSLPRAISASWLETSPAGVYSGDIHAIIWDLDPVAANSTYTYYITGRVDTGYLGQTMTNTGYFLSDMTHSWDNLILYSAASFDIAWCGDGNLGVWERCDDGDLDNTNSCTNTCELPTCGDSFIQGWELCDDGNTDDGDGCSSMCQIEAICGNGDVEPLVCFTCGTQSYITGLSYLVVNALTWYTYYYDEIGTGYRVDREVVLSGSAIASGYQWSLIDWYADTWTIVTWFVIGSTTGQTISMFGMADDLLDDNRSAWLKIEVTTTAGDVLSLTGVVTTSNKWFVLLYPTSDVTSITNMSVSRGEVYLGLAGIYSGDMYTHTGFSFSWFDVDYSLYDIGYDWTSDGNYDYTGVNQAMIHTYATGNQTVIYAVSLGLSTGDENDPHLEMGLIGQNALFQTVYSTGDTPQYEQCDYGDLDNGDGCSDTCTWETPICTFGADVYSGPAPLSVNFLVAVTNMTSNYTYDYIDFGDGTTGRAGGYIYNTGVYYPTLYVSNTLTGGIQASCSIDLAITATEIICGDGNTEWTEQCDDGDNDDNDECTNSCHYAMCGDGILHEGVEQCDVGMNKWLPTGCSMSCMIQIPTCTLSGTPTTGDEPLSVDFETTYSNFATVDYIDYGDGSTGAEVTGHIYNGTGGYYTPILYIHNTAYPSQTGSCQAAEDIYVTPTYCGDGTPQTPNSSGFNEACDLGEDNGTSGCSDTCTVQTPTCTIVAQQSTGYAPFTGHFDVSAQPWVDSLFIDYGDGTTGVVQSHLYADTGLYTVTLYVANSVNSTYTNSCTADITVQELPCGNNTIDTGEQCDDGIGNGQIPPIGYGPYHYCSNSCTFISGTGQHCGDGTKNGPEQCDSGANNGLVCDPSYGSSCNYCDVSCHTNTVQGGYCGDNNTDIGEQCDDGNNDDHDLCSNTCVANCGDGNLDTNEECDLGEDNGLGGCTSSCLFAPPVCTIAVPNYSQGIIPVYVPFNILCLDYTTLTYIDYGDGTTGTNFSGHLYHSSGWYSPTIYFKNILWGPVADDDDDLEVSVTPQRCGDGIINGHEECDGTRNCTASCTKRTGGDSTPPPLPKDKCPNGDFSASYYDKTCGVQTEHAAAEILDKYSIIHGDYNKWPEDPARYALNRILKRSELRKIMVRTMTDQKYQAPFMGETWADKYKMILEGKLGVVYGKTRAHEDQVTYIEAINSVLEALHYLGRLKTPVTIRTMAGGSRPITRGQMMALIVRFVLPEAMQSLQATAPSAKR